MLERDSFMPIPYLKKAKYTGSYEGMRYRMEKASKEREGADGEKKEESYLLVSLWPEPYSYDATPPEKIEFQEFEFSESGIQEGVRWLNEKYEKEFSAP